MKWGDVIHSCPSALAIVFLVFCAGICLGTPAQAQSSSASYRLAPVTIDAAGGPSAGASTSANASLGQELVVGASSAPHFILQSGFWSFLGSTVVPVVLTVNRNPGDAAAIDLTWSGNNAFYDVYSSTDERCASLYESVPAATSANSRTDSAPPPAPLVCYSVLAVAPGPLAPPPRLEALP